MFSSKTDGAKAHADISDSLRQSFDAISNASKYEQIELT